MAPGIRSRYRGPDKAALRWFLPCSQFLTSSFRLWGLSLVWSSAAGGRAITALPASWLRCGLASITRPALLAGLRSWTDSILVRAVASGPGSFTVSISWTVSSGQAFLGPDDLRSGIILINPGLFLESCSSLAQTASFSSFRRLLSLVKQA